MQRKKNRKKVRKLRKKATRLRKLLAKIRKNVKGYYRRFQTYRYRVPVMIAVVCLLWFYACPEPTIVPVRGAHTTDWESDYFWDCPWCTRYEKHMGIDIIKDAGTPVVASTHGMIVYKGWFGKYGKVVILVSPKVRIHLYGHLNRQVESFNPFARQGSVIGLVGSTGLSDLPHLHYTIVSVLPHFWRFEITNRGWLKMFFLNPDDIMEQP